MNASSSFKAPCSAATRPCPSMLSEGSRSPCCRLGGTLSQHPPAFIAVRNRRWRLALADNFLRLFRAESISLFGAPAYVSPMHVTCCASGRGVLGARETCQRHQGPSLHGRSSRSMPSSRVMLPVPWSRRRGRNRRAHVGRDFLRFIQAADLQCRWARKRRAICRRARWRRHRRPLGWCAARRTSARSTPARRSPATGIPVTAGGSRDHAEEVVIVLVLVLVCRRVQLRVVV